MQVAEEVIAQEDIILLSERDFDRFVALIENPPTTENLRRLMAEYEARKLAHPEANV